MVMVNETLRISSTAILLAGTFPWSPKVTLAITSVAHTSASESFFPEKNALFV